MSLTWIRGALYFAGAWNILGGGGALADPAGHFSQMYHGALSLADPIQAFFFRGTWINVIAWGIGYILAGVFRAAAAPVLVAGGVGKLTYFGACLALYSSGAGTGLLLATGICDVMFALFFGYVVWRGRLEKSA